MRPIDMEILLHYHVFVEEMEEVRRSVPSYVDGVRFLKDQGLLQQATSVYNVPPPYEPATFQLTPKGRFWVEYVLRTPLPVQASTFHIPERQ